MTLSVARCLTNKQELSVRLLEPHENIAINSCAVTVKLLKEYRVQEPTVLSWRKCIHVFCRIVYWLATITCLYIRKTT